ncbi:hypothetical protein IWW54_005287 [Coemansia sp. RSA 2705]|nr:hypothetical protein IWW54_005287 [Coemansia sp. RSA 2705]
MPDEQMTSANQPRSHAGRTYHVETQPGQMANRIITVGDPARARMLAQHLDPVLFEHASHRGFLTITGLYRGLPLSIVAIGMGPSMMDFFVRETRMVVDGPLAIVRLGSCGSICQARIGDVIVAKGAFGIGRNYAFFDGDQEDARGDAYVVWPAVGADERLTGRVAGGLGRALGMDRVFEGLVGNADSFYGSQGRQGDDFYDANAGLLDLVHKQQPGAVALEMECHVLFHLAKASTGSRNQRPASVRAACALMVFADRAGNQFIGPETSRQMVKTAARAILDALVDDMPTQQGLHPEAGSVWENKL